MKKTIDVELKVAYAGIASQNFEIVMLTLNGVTIALQDFGTILCVHLVGSTKEAVESRYFSFWNHQSTGGELEWENDVQPPYHAFFWIYTGKTETAAEKLVRGLTRGAMSEMLPPNAHAHTKGTNPWSEACELGESRFQQMEHVTWLDMRTEVEIFEFGDSVAAEKGTGNFDDDVLGKVVTRGGNMTLDMIKATKEHTDEEYERESVGEDV